MPKCLHCEVEFSSSVLGIHQEWCESRDSDNDTSDELTELREKAAALGIKSIKNKKIETLKAEIAAAEADH